MRPTNRSRSRARKWAYAVGVVLPLGAIGVLAMPGTERLHAAGPANTGHEALTCESCHTSAPGSVRQQVQANIAYVFGQRENEAHFYKLPITNDDCLACHDNEVDRHPVYRFNEARFEKARAAIAPHLCVSCHQEHQGGRVTATHTFCVNCHAEIDVKKDPIDPSHKALANEAKWSTCLGCHDFHGNHTMKSPTRMEDMASEDAVLDYFRGGPSIYGNEIRFPAKKTRGQP
jgi:hypothetical protein